MLGNDVIDLELARKESNWRRKGFLDKIFTKSEQNLILKSENQEVTVWNLWSRKEAAYKIWNRETGVRSYNPIKFENLDLNPEIGKVKFEHKIYYTKSEISDQFIYVIATSEKENLEKIEILENTICIEKQNGIPFYKRYNTIISPISKSQHGRFEKIISIKFPI